MHEGLQIAKSIIKKEIDKRRYKIVNSLDESKKICLMIEIFDCHSPSVELYYIKKNDDILDEILESFHFGNQFSFFTQ